MVMKMSLRRIKDSQLIAGMPALSVVRVLVGERSPPAQHHLRPGHSPSGPAAPLPVKSTLSARGKGVVLLLS